VGTARVTTGGGPRAPAHQGLGTIVVMRNRNLDLTGLVGDEPDFDLRRSA
jgi:hypothetical protein